METTYDVYENRTFQSRSLLTDTLSLDVISRLKFGLRIWVVEGGHLVLRCEWVKQWNKSELDAFNIYVP
jgi:hypothetical protein